MKKLRILYFFICFFLFAIQIMAQNLRTGTWQDGTPSFARVSSVDSVRIDSLVSLIPLPGSKEEPDAFQFILDGLDWTWPDGISVLSAEDIDYRSFLGTDLYLVTDGSGRRVIEVDPTIPQIVWEFEGQLGTPRFLEKPIDAYAYRESGVVLILITDQGRHRVIKVVRETKSIIWQYGDETEGSGFNQLSSPTDAIALADSGVIFICDKGNNRVILVNESNNSIIWNWGLGELSNPVDIEYDSNTQEVLITDQNNHRVIKVNRQTNGISWQFGTGLPDSLDNGLNLPADADFLPNGNILICDAGNNRLIEVDNSGQVVWQFGTRLKNLKDADRLLNNKHLAITDKLPVRLAYITRAFTSDTRDIGSEVSYDSLFWSADTLNGFTSIKLQLRTANTLGDLESAPWLGPTVNIPYYTNPGSKINSDHNGHRFYQFKAILETNDPLYTPVLKNVKITYNNYDTKTTGRILSEQIRDTSNFIITKWNTLRFDTILPANPANRNKVELKISIINSQTGEVLRSFVASNVNNTNSEALSNIETLKRIQAIQLQATLKTNSTAATPTLNNWSVEWEATPSTGAQIYFVNQELKLADHYKVSESFQPDQPYIDRVTILLNDPNLIPIQDIVNLNVVSLQSKDSENINLILQPDGYYLLKPSLPAIILDRGLPDINNGFLQVFDRDTLVISYTDPTTPTDQAIDSILIIQDAEGSIRFENTSFTPIDSVSIGETIYVRILDETDRSITPQQDTVSVIVFDYGTNDEESLLLVEVPDDSNKYDTGEFISTLGLPLVESRTQINNDSLIQTIKGSRIGIEYDDTISEISILQVRGRPSFPDTLPSFASGELYFDMAPNPYYGNRLNEYLRIRVSSSIGDITVEKVEIFNFAGQKIRVIDGAQLTFYYYYPIPIDQFSIADRWWNLKAQNGTDVSSGTYWIKLFARVVETNKILTRIQKLVIIR